MCPYLNLQLMVILNCFTLDRDSLLYAEDSSEHSFLDNPGLVVGVFLHKLEKHDFVAVGIAISNEMVVTACAPLVKQFRGQEIVTYDMKMYSVVARMDLKEQGRMVSSVECFYTDGWKLKMKNSSVGKGYLGVLKIEMPFETKTTTFVTISSRIHWDIGMRCKLYYFKDEMEPTFSFTLQSFDVVSVRHRHLCSEFALAETGIEPSTNQLCGFPLFPNSPPCDVIVPGSPVFCSGSLLIGLTDNSSFSTMAGRCFFLVDAFTAVSIDHRLPPAGRATSSNPRIRLDLIPPLLTFLYRDFPS